MPKIECPIIGWDLGVARAWRGIIGVASATPVATPLPPLVELQVRVKLVPALWSESELRVVL